MDCERDRPAELQNAAAEESKHPAVAQAEAMLRQLVADGMRPAQVAEAVFEAIREGRFYILTHEDWKPHVRKRMDDILLGRNPC